MTKSGVSGRARLLAVAMLLACAMCPRAAMAAADTCPVTSVGFLPANPARTLFGFMLIAPRARSISGDIAVDTDHGWFRIRFADVRIERRSAGGLSSRVLYARFPETIAIRRFWVEEAGVPCYPPDGGQPPVVRQGPLMERPPVPGDTVIAAAIRAPYGRMDCAQPFSPVRALTIVEPGFPPRQATFPGTALVEVTVSADGKVSDAKLIGSSHTSGFDQAALDAAKISKYAPANAYCLPTVGHYLYKATVTPL